jgi:membrane protease YdiL (CAAX protease family)
MLVAVILASFLITGLVGILMGMPFYGTGILDNISGDPDLNDPTVLGFLKYFQIISQLGFFVIPPFLFALLVDKYVFGYLKLDISPSLLSSVAGCFLVITALPFLHWMADLNEMIRLPEFMAGIEEWMRDSENRARELTEAFIKADTYAILGLNILVIAVLPALGEELLFRGVLLRFFKDWTGNVHMAVLISSVLFSALHFQFFGFIPRLFLGLVLGYLFVWTGSIWVPIIVHFINNGLAVVVAFYVDRFENIDSYAEVGSTDDPVFIIISASLVVLLSIFVYFYEKKRKHRTSGISSL